MYACETYRIMLRISLSSSSSRPFPHVCHTHLFLKSYFSRSKFYSQLKIDTYAETWGGGGGGQWIGRTARIKIRVDSRSGPSIFRRWEDEKNSEQEESYWNIFILILTSPSLVTKSWDVLPDLRLPLPQDSSFVIWEWQEKENVKKKGRITDMTQVTVILLFLFEKSP